MQRHAVSGIVLRVYELRSRESRHMLFSPGQFTWTLAQDRPSQRYPIWGRAFVLPGNILVEAAGHGYHYKSVEDLLNDRPGIWETASRLEGVTPCTWRTVEDSRSNGVYMRLENLVITGTGDYEVFSGAFGRLLETHGMKTTGRLSPLALDVAPPPFSVDFEEALPLVPSVPLDEGTLHALHKMVSYSPPGCSVKGGVIASWRPRSFVVMRSQSPISEEQTAVIISQHLLEAEVLHRANDDLRLEISQLHAKLHGLCHHLPALSVHIAGGRALSTLEFFMNFNYEETLAILAGTPEFAHATAPPGAAYHIAQNVVIEVFRRLHLTVRYLRSDGAGFPEYEHIRIHMTDVQALLVCIHAHERHPEQVRTLVDQWQELYDNVFHTGDFLAATRLKALLLKALPGTLASRRRMMDIFEYEMCIALRNKIDKSSWSCYK